MARKSSKTTPTVISGVLYSDDGANGIRLTDPEWSMWLEDATGFYYDHADCGFTCKKQKHRNGYFWYAYKRVNGRLHKRYLGMRENVTLDRLKLQAQTFSRLL